MCAPNTMAGIGLTSQATGALVRAAGLFGNTKAARDAAEYNARYAEQQAADARTRGQKELYRSRRQYRQTGGSARAHLAASGVDLTQGNPLEILTGIEYAQSQDEATIRENARREAFGYTVRAANYRSEAHANNPWLAATGSLLTDAGRVADRWYQYKKVRKGV